jgi:four helix bundle protein
MSYRNLEVWKLSRKLSILIHKMSLTLPRFELYETGSQIRRSSNSIRSNIVEGYGRRRYKFDYIRFLTHSHASVLETTDHLETLTYLIHKYIDDRLYLHVHQ